MASTRDAYAFIRDLQYNLRRQGLIKEYDDVRNAIIKRQNGLITNEEAHQVLTRAYEQYKCHMTSLSALKPIVPMARGGRRPPRAKKPRKKRTRRTNPSTIATSSKPVARVTKTHVRKTPPPTISHISILDPRDYPNSTYANRCARINDILGKLDPMVCQMIKDAANILVHDLSDRMICAATVRQTDQKYTAIALRRNPTTRGIRLEGIRYALKKTTFPLYEMSKRAGKEERYELLLKQEERERIQQSGTREERKIQFKQDEFMCKMQESNKVAMMFSATPATGPTSRPKRKTGVSRSDTPTQNIGVSRRDTPPPLPPLVIDETIAMFAINDYHRCKRRFPLSYTTQDYMQAGALHMLFTHVL